MLGAGRLAGAELTCPPPLLPSLRRPLTLVTHLVAASPPALVRLPLSAETPFEDGTFRLVLTFDESYPNKPPVVKFLSKMFHPNVYANGELCLDILQNRWSPTYDVAAILTSIQSLLHDPNPNRCVSARPPLVFLLLLAKSRLTSRLLSAPAATYSSLPMNGRRTSLLSTLPSSTPHDARAHAAPPTPKPPNCTATTTRSTSSACARRSSGAGSTRTLSSDPRREEMLACPPVLL